MSQPVVAASSPRFQSIWGQILRNSVFVGFHFVLLLPIWVGWSWQALAFCAAAYLSRMFIITGAYHRYFSHKCYKTSRPFQFFLGLCGVLCIQKGPLWWAAHHRHHHAESDQPGDVHSPRQRGFLHAHMGWITSGQNDHTRWERIPELARYPELIVELGRESDPETLSRALALARASLEERPTASNLRQVAMLEEASGELDSALERRISLHHFVPSDLENREALLRVLDRLVAQRAAANDTYQVLSLTGTGFLVAERSGDPQLLAAWSPRLDRAYRDYIDEAIASGDPDEARRRVESLAGTFPNHPLLERYRELRHSTPPRAGG